MYPVSRREALSIGGTTLLGGLAGCLSDSSDGDDGTTPDGRTIGTATPTPEPTVVPEMDAEPRIDSRFDDADDAEFGSGELVLYHAIHEPVAAHLSPLHEAVHPDDLLRFSLFNNHFEELRIDPSAWTIERRADGEWSSVAAGDATGDETELGQGDTRTWPFRRDVLSDHGAGVYAFHVDGTDAVTGESQTFATLFELVDEPRIDQSEASRTIGVETGVHPDGIAATLRAELVAPHDDDPATIRFSVRSEAFQTITTADPAPFGEPLGNRMNAPEELILADDVSEEEGCWIGESSEATATSHELVLGETIERELRLATPPGREYCLPAGRYRFANTFRTERNGSTAERSLGITVSVGSE